MERKLRLSGLTCTHCEETIKKELKKHPSIQSVSVSYKTGIMYLKGPKWISNQEINQLIQPLGYEIDKDKNGLNLLILVFGLVLFVGFQYLYGQFSFDPTQSNLSIGLVVAYGLVSSLHCVSMCGGLALSASLNQKKYEVHELYTTVSKWSINLLYCIRIITWITGFCISIIQ